VDEEAAATGNGSVRGQNDDAGRRGAAAGLLTPVGVAGGPGVDCGTPALEVPRHHAAELPPTTVTCTTHHSPRHRRRREPSHDSMRPRLVGTYSCRP
jgi:hypothetical protein